MPLQYPAHHQDDVSMERDMRQFGRSLAGCQWCARRDLNPRPTAYKTGALTG